MAAGSFPALLPTVPCSVPLGHVTHHPSDATRPVDLRTSEELIRRNGESPSRCTCSAERGGAG